MSFLNRFGKMRQANAPDTKLDTLAAGEVQEPALNEALANFRASVIAWSDAEFVSARTPIKVVRKRSWRLAAGWALGCVLVAGGVGGGVQQHHQHKLAVERDRLAKQQLAEQQKITAELQAREEEDLLANVDSDVSREVPSAMEPLARLMPDDESK